MYAQIQLVYEQVFTKNLLSFQQDLGSFLETSWDYARFYIFRTSSKKHFKTSLHLPLYLQALWKYFFFSNFTTKALKLCLVFGESRYWQFTSPLKQTADVSKLTIKNNFRVFIVIFEDK